MLLNFELHWRCFAVMVLLEFSGFSNIETAYQWQATYKIGTFSFSSSRYDFCWHAMLAAQWNEKLCTGDTSPCVTTISVLFSAVK